MSDPQSIDLEYVRLNEENQVLRQALLEAHEKCKLMESADKDNAMEADMAKAYAADLEKERDDLKQQLAEAQAACAVLQRYGEQFVKKINVIHENEDYRSVWTIAQFHQGPYGGPNYAEEFSVFEGVINKSADYTKGWLSPDEAAPLREAREALQGRLGDDPKAIVWACEEYVAAEDALPDRFDSEDYRLSKAVASLVAEADEAAKQLERWECLARLVPQPPNAITWEHGVELLNKLQDLAWPREALKGQP